MANTADLLPGTLDLLILIAWDRWTSVWKYGSVRLFCDTPSLTKAPSAARWKFTKLPRSSAHSQADEVPTTARQVLIGVPWKAD